MSSRLRRVYVRWLPLALALIAMLNFGLGYFLSVSARPIRFHDDGSLTNLAHTEQLTVNRRFGLYMELGDVAGGGTLYVPPGSPVNADLARAFSNVIVTELDYDPHDVPAGVVPREEPIGPFATDDGDVPYWIIPGNPAETHWWLGRTSEGIVVVPESVAPVPGDSP